MTVQIHATNMAGSGRRAQVWWSLHILGRNWAPAKAKPRVFWGHGCRTHAGARCLLVVNDSLILLYHDVKWTIIINHYFAEQWLDTVDTHGRKMVDIAFWVLLSQDSVILLADDDDAASWLWSSRCHALLVEKSPNPWWLQATND